MIILSFILMTITVEAKILPAIFYGSSQEKEAFCGDEEFQNEAFWRKLTSDSITENIKDGDEVTQNSYVTLSYLELSKLASRHEDSKFMGYVYANASHHLGRLLRFHQWPYNHPLKKSDQGLVKGSLLRVAVFTASNELSRRLMFHSLNLYKELMWSLLPTSLCGADYTLSFVTSEDLQKAFSASNTNEFIQAFVTYEQSYLQKEMYSDFLIGSSARAGILDEMRFISFNGEEQMSFKRWCETESCQTTSFDLTNRIEFDTLSFINEFIITQGMVSEFKRRALQANIEKTALFFLSK